MRMEHGDSVTRKVKANFKNFLGKAKTFGRKRGGGGGGGDVSEGAAAVGTLRSEEATDVEEVGEDELRTTGVSGIAVQLWPAQEFGEEGVAR